MKEENTIEVKKSYVSEVRRALDALGFFGPKDTTALETFSRWIDSIQAIEQSDEMKATWTQFMVARFGGVDSTCTRETVDEAAQAATYACVLQTRTFPPRARTGLDNGPEIPTQVAEAYYAELQEWRSAAYAAGFATPESLRDSHEQRKEWQLATGRNDPDDAKGRIDALIALDISRHKKLTEAQAEIACWQSETGCMTPSGAGELIRQLRQDKTSLDLWHSLFGKVSAIEAYDEVKRQRSEMVERSAHVALVKAWESSTGCDTPNAARELILQLRDMKREASEGREQAWVDATGRKYPADAEQRIDDLELHLAGANNGISELSAKLAEKDAEWQGHLSRAVDNCERYWREKYADLKLQANELSAKLQERDQDLLSANAEIDRVKKAARTLGLVSDDAKELAKVRAELHTKCREAQTERERADSSDRECQKLRSEIDNARSVLSAALATHDGLGVDAQKGVIHEELPELHVLSTRVVDTMARNESRELNECYDDLHDTRLALNIIRDAFTRKVSGARLVAEKWQTVALELEKLIDSVIWPLPKPDNVEVGQRWAKIHTVTDVRAHDVYTNHLVHPPVGRELAITRNDSWIYLGK